MRRRLPRALAAAFLAALWAGAAEEPLPPVEPLIERMGDRQFRIREEAFQALSARARADAAARDALAAAVARHPDLEVRERARMILEETELPFLETVLEMPGLAERLSSGDLKEQFEALASVPRAPEAFPLFRRFVADRQANAQLRSLALEASARLPLSEVRALLRDVARDTGEPLREQAIAWLGRLRETAAAPDLLGVARDPRDAARLRACYALVAMRHAPALSLLRELVADAALADDLRSLAVIGCGRMRDVQSLPALLALARGETLSRPDHPLRIFAVRALGDLPDPRAGAVLLDLVVRPGDGSVQREACLALGARREAEAVEALRRCLEDGGRPLRVRKAAVAALRRITGWERAGPLEAQAAFYKERMAR